MADEVALPTALCSFLDKRPEDFTRADLLRVVVGCGVERFTFHYTGMDSQLKELQLPFADHRQAERILAMGERVDGSSLFRGLVDVSDSDLYVVPDYRTAFLNPFDPTSLDFMCRFLDRHGDLAPFSPDNMVRMAHERVKTIGYELHALGEVEFFLLYDSDNDLYTPAKHSGYHASAPFFRGGPVVTQMIRCLEQITGSVKYAHAEAGFIDSIRSDSPVLKGLRAEQHEIELLARPIEEMGDVVALTKWVVRNVAHRHGLLATFAPKLEEGVAGNGLHFHLELLQADRNVMVKGNAELSDPALRLIGGLVHYAATLTAFGNTVASAYLRLVPNQEAPTRICWSESNRSALIRVPLGWSEKCDLARAVNPQDTSEYADDRGRQTVELRSPDGSAHFHLLLAGIAAAGEWGLSSPSSLELARTTHVEGNVFACQEILSGLEALPASCVAAGRLLRERRDLFDSRGVFPPKVVDYIVDVLMAENDEYLNEKLSHMAADERLHATRQIMHRDIHKH